MFRRRGLAKREKTAALEGAVREAFRAVYHVPRTCPKVLAIGRRRWPGLLLAPRRRHDVDSAGG
eukprot:4984972-Alexandrium_andersonii.AAC.1